MVYPALLPLMRTIRLPVFDWTDAPADLNGLVCFAGRRNLVSARVPSHLKRSLQIASNVFWRVHVEREFWIFWLVCAYHTIDQTCLYGCAKEILQTCTYKSSWGWTLEWSKHVEDTIIKLKHWYNNYAFYWFLLRGGAVNSLARHNSRCRRTESIRSLERGFCSCAELQVFSCYTGWKEACQATCAISTTSRRELSSSFFFPARQGAEGNSRHSDKNIRGTCTIVYHRQKLGGPV